MKLPTTTVTIHADDHLIAKRRAFDLGVSIMVWVGSAIRSQATDELTSATAPPKRRKLARKEIVYNAKA